MSFSTKSIENEGTFYQINPQIHDVKYFTYKEARYEIDFDQLKLYSTFFLNEEEKFKNIECIQLLKDSETKYFDLSESSIQTFILCCQGKNFKINKEDVTALHFLSIKFAVSGLQDVIQSYISNNEKELIFDLLSFKQKFINLYNTEISHEKYEQSLYLYSNQNTAKEEQILLDNFPFYVRDKRFSTLSVPLIYRVVSKYYKNTHENDEYEIRFLFDCLDYHKRRASVLFSVIQIDESHKYVIDKLLNDYSDVFDFNFLNKSLVKNVHDISSEMIKMNLKFEQQKQEMEQMKTDFSNIFKQQKQEMEQMKTDFSNIFKQKKKEMEQMKTGFNDVSEQQKQEMDQMKTDFSNIFKQQKQEMEQIKTEFNDVSEQQEEKLKASLSHIKQKIFLLHYPKIFKFDSTGNHFLKTPLDGNYKLEVWGAQGGPTYNGGRNAQGGKGGYSVGTIHLKEGTLLYINVGCQGGKSISMCQSGGGFNGGGAGYYHSNGNENNAYVGGGGGSTDIRINENSLYSRVIVAGGGGAAGYQQQEITGGFGGGTCGESMQTHLTTDRRSNGGTQIAGGRSTNSSAESGSFGQGGNGIGTRVAGGGGGWYGGSACFCGYAAGGSGWIYTESSFNNWREGNQTDSSKWLLNPEYYLTDAKTIGGNQEIPSHDGSSQTVGNSGNGYALITAFYSPNSALFEE